MVMVLLAPGGHKKVMQAFDYFRAVMKERMRFQMLTASITQEPVDPAYQVLRFDCLFKVFVPLSHFPLFPSPSLPSHFSSSSSSSSPLTILHQFSTMHTFLEEIPDQNPVPFSLLPSSYRLQLYVSSTPWYILPRGQTRRCSTSTSSWRQGSV